MKCKNTAIPLHKANVINFVKDINSLNCKKIIQFLNIEIPKKNL